MIKRSQHLSFILILYFAADSSLICAYFLSLTGQMNRWCVAPLDGLNTELSHQLGQTLTQVSTLIFIKVILWFWFTPYWLLNTDGHLPGDHRSSQQDHSTHTLVWIGWDKKSLQVLKYFQPYSNKSCVSWYISPYCAAVHCDEGKCLYCITFWGGE